MYAQLPQATVGTAGNQRQWDNSVCRAAAARFRSWLTTNITNCVVSDKLCNLSGTLLSNVPCFAMYDAYFFAQVCEGKIRMHIIHG